MDEYREKGIVFHKSFFDKIYLVLIEEARQMFVLQMVRRLFEKPS